MPVKEDIRANKAGLRVRMRKIRESFPFEVKSEYDAEIALSVLSLKEYKESRAVFLYISKELEVDTSAIFNAALADGKNVAAPICDKDTKRMDFYRVSSAEELKKGSYGILEPNSEICEKVTDLSSGLCIVPGLSFDGEGYRLGFGMGYYDRFLPRFGGTSVGICYSDCVCRRLPHGYYDRSVTVLVTEEYIKNFKRR